MRKLILTTAAVAAAIGLAGCSKTPTPKSVSATPDTATLSVNTPPADASAFSETAVGGQRLEMAFVAGGTFTMGCAAEQGSDCDDDERPAHSVTLSDYYIGKREVTQGLWKAVTGGNPSHFTGSDNLPVENVSWDEVNAFIDSLNRKTGRTYRLPTEAEWEYAARGGNNSGGYKYSGSNTLDSVAWYWDNSGHKTHEAGTKAPNELGIYDMSGNVWEWTGDWYGDYGSDAQSNPTGPSTGSIRVLRGGSWSYGEGNCRVSNRGGSDPDSSIDGIGFRFVLLSP
jgi:formylglycine-generating enzyme required for sulfatase activity